MLTPPDQEKRRPVFKIAAIDDQEKFKPLPKPPGVYPYHLQLKDIVSELPASKMVFHLCGDTGGFTQPYLKHKVATEMIRQFDEAKLSEDKPLFFFHLGDVVYSYGQAKEYERQFFNHYDNYPGPIFAIAGNHDADIDPLDTEKPESLAAFMQVFCNPSAKPVPFAGKSKGKSNVQPNVYYTLHTPLATIICLYSNVPRFGTITDDQKQWFLDELKNAGNNRKKKALIVCLHHSAYSADINHGSSIHMQQFLTGSFEATGVYPDVVFSGHVHNYQRFSKTYPNGKIVPFIIAGAGGYAELHNIAKADDPAFPDSSPLLDHVSLENYCDERHGFLKVSIEKTGDQLSLDGRYYIIPAAAGDLSPAMEFDSFSVNI